MADYDAFEKRKKKRSERKHDYKDSNADSFLIVTEGTRTEPLYFEGIRKIIHEKIGGRIDIPTIDICGEGRSTEKLIEITERLIKNAKIIYKNVWIVFDKDDFNDFDEAIREAERNEYHVAWSNQAFEYWLYLHFNYSDAALHRRDWENKLDDIFRSKGLGDGGYRKNYEDIFSMVSANGGLNRAINNAKRRMKEFDGNSQRPSGYDPGTTVYQLVEELKKFMD